MSRFQVEPRLSTWRKVALSAWGRANDPTIYGFLDLDATRAIDYVRRVREATGVKATVTHVIGKAVALAFAANPECNAVVSFGRLKRRDTVDVFFQVDVGGGANLSGAKVERCDELSIADIARNLGERTERIRQKGDTALQKTQSMMMRLPTVLMGPALRLSEMATYDLGLDLTRLGVPFDAFGTVMVTNVGVLGIERGLAPLLPLSRVPALLTVGAIKERVVAVDGAPAVRPMVTVGCTFDHRVSDGYQLGRMSVILRDAFENPDERIGPVGA